MSLITKLITAPVTIPAKVETAVRAYNAEVQRWRDDEGFGNSTWRPWHDGMAEAGETEEVAKARWYAIRQTPAEAKAKRDEEAKAKDTYRPVDRSKWLLEGQARNKEIDAELAKPAPKQTMADKIRLFWSL